MKPTAAELDGFEETIGFALPIDYRDFMLAFNGGTVVVEHDIHVPALSCEVFVSNFLPFTEESPSLGVVEARLMQEELRLCLRQALRIGGDMGTGFFYILMAGDETGAVYYGFKDNIPILEGDWYSSDVVIPECLVKISASFNALGQTILANRNSSHG